MPYHHLLVDLPNLLLHIHVSAFWRRYTGSIGVRHVKELGRQDRRGIAGRYGEELEDLRTTDVQYLSFWGAVGC